MLNTKGFVRDMGIDVNNLSFAFGRREVLHDVCFSINDGQFAAILGPNGAGKTTLFRCILGFLKDYTGNISCAGQDISALGPRYLAKLMAYIPQSATPVFNHTVLDMVLMGTNSHAGRLSTPGKAQTEAAELALEKLGIIDFRSRGCRTLSGGEAQLVLIARALAQGAKALIMDEPSANLDLGNKQRVLMLARQLSREGYTVLMSVHEPDQALVYADRALVLSNGRVIADGAVGDVITETLISDVYGVNVKISLEPNGKGILYSS